MADHGNQRRGSLWRWAGRGVLGAGLVLGCAGQTLPDPRDAAQSYADALRRGDADAVYALASRASREHYGKAGIARIMKDARKELAVHGSAVADRRAEVHARGKLRYESGIEVNLTIEEGRSLIDSAGVLPLEPRSPTDALRELRAVLMRGGHRGLLRVLSTDARTELAAEIDGLVAALEDPETLDVRVNGEDATVDAPGGHRVVLRKEQGAWRVVDFK